MESRICELPRSRESMKIRVTRTCSCLPNAVCGVPEYVRLKRLIFLP